MQSKNKDWFRYNRYWREWSRVLVRGGGNYDHEISIPLTPVNDGDSEWGEVGKVLIKKFDVRFDASRSENHYTHVLPDEIKDRITSKLGIAKANVLLHANILPLIDWEEHQSLGDTYVPFELCQIKQEWFYHHVNAGKGESRESFPTEEQFNKDYGVEMPEGFISLGGVYHIHGDEHFRCVGTYDLANGIVSVEVMMSGEDYDIVTRFASKYNGTWHPSLISYLSKSDYTKLENIDAVMRMASTIINNMMVYNK